MRTPPEFISPWVKPMTGLGSFWHLQSVLPLPSLLTVVHGKVFWLNECGLYVTAISIYSVVLVRNRQFSAAIHRLL